MDSYDYTNGRSPKRLKQFAEPTMQGLLSDETPAAASSSLPPTYPLPSHNFDDDIMSSSPPATIPTQLVATQVLSTPTRSDLPSTIPTQIIGTPLRNGGRLPAAALQYETVPTQIIGTPTQAVPSSVVQVAASSPVVKESPIRPAPRGLSVSSTPTPTAKPPYVVKVDLNSDMEVPYAGSSSEDEEARSATNTSATAFYQSRPKASPRVSESPVQRVDPVANMRSFAGQFAYAAASKAPNWTRAAADLEKLKTSHAKAQKRPAAPQRGPSAPRPSAVIDLSGDSSLVDRLKREFPQQGIQQIVKTVSDSNHDYKRAKGALQKHQLVEWGVDPKTTIPKILRVYPWLEMGQVVEALIKTRGSYDRALQLLANVPPNPLDVIVLDDDKGGRAKAKRNTQRAPTKTIREKFSHIGATQPLPPSPSKPTAQSPPTPSEGSSLASKPRKRLVQGKKLQRTQSPEEPETVDLVSSEEDAPEEDEEDEVHVSGRTKTVADMLSFINSTDVAGLVDLSFTDEETAEMILSHRPFSSIREVQGVVNPNVMKGRGRNAKPKNIGEKVVDQCIETWEGFIAVDTLLKECKSLGDKITDGMKGWDVERGGSSTEGLDIVVPGEGGSPKPGHSGLSQGMQGLMSGQPKLMAEDIQLKPYQFLGVKWLDLLHELRLGCILADEMGLGKTCQVIGFLALLLEKGVEGPHIVVVPPSTLENWLREFKRFCPTLKVEPYYGSLEERQEMRIALDENPDFNVIITTYNMFQGTSRNNKIDQGFLRKWSYDVAIFDEGHQLKNNTSDRAVSLSRLHVRNRILLTGTPLQNNLQELMNLLAFILPTLFENKYEHLNAIFKYKAKTSDNISAASKLLSLERVKRAKAMMTPFVLRRKKVQVLHDLPKKFQHVTEVELTSAQAEVYQKTVDSAIATAATDDNNKPITKTSLLMRLRQAAIHPMLSRRFYTDATVRKMAEAIKKEPQYDTEDHDVDVIEGEMLQYNDYELDKLCQDYPMTLKSFKLENEEWMDSAKVLALKDILLKAKDNGDRVLVFSQFTMVLDLLEKVLGTIEMPFLRLDGSTNVALRQELIDQFEEEKDITAFLLSTKAGGVGLNLAAANKVVIFDASFNPFDDLQAEDRAWRIGQTRDVHVIRIISKGTIEENIDQLAKTKLMLDASKSFRSRVARKQEPGNGIAKGKAVDGGVGKQGSSISEREAPKKAEDGLDTKGVCEPSVEKVAGEASSSLKRKAEGEDTDTSAQAKKRKEEDPAIEETEGEQPGAGRRLARSQSNASAVTKDGSTKRSNESIAQKTEGEKASPAQSLVRSTSQANPPKKETSSKRTLEDAGGFASVAKKQKKDVDKAQGYDGHVILSSKRKRTSTESSPAPTNQQSKSKSPTSSGSQNANDASQGQVARQQRMIEHTEPASSSVKQNAEMSKSSTPSPRRSGKASPGDQAEGHHGTAENDSRPKKRYQSRPVSETPESAPASSKSTSQKGKTPPRGKELRSS
ncbi:hypothetical protein TWF679_000794 [Orbilia oligospora]|uniref:SWI SNF-, matrix-associated actin-dependent regulator of chromatin, sub a, containing DEAD H box n=1 Tax=Orbilia oligospora TaxID=2813651 RepID=A0A8H8UWQ5_ORBOL|nr:hypothetical protein TWF679_000794 [Orbilia oligospora]